MNSNLFSFLKSLSVCLPFLIALFRIKNIDRQYNPFIAYLFLGLLTEIVSFVVIDIYKKPNAAVVNVYLLAEWYLIVWQFYNWGLFRDSMKKLFIVTSFGLAAWITENIIAEKFFVFGPYCRWLFSFVIVVMSINAINYTITHDFRNLFRNARFIICLCFIVFFSYKIIYEWAYQILDIKNSFELSNRIISFFGYLNAFINTMYIVAVLLIPLETKPGLKGAEKQSSVRLL